MIAVVADHDDRESWALVTRWRHAGAVLVTPDDLSRPGWVLSSFRPGSFVAESRRYPTDALTGVLVRLDAVDAGELAAVEEEDREYGAAEMTAFLSAWLTALACPVINRPSPGFLLGPAWSQEHWLASAAAVGVPVTSEPMAVGGLEWCTVVAGSAYGSTLPEVRRWSIRLAREAGVDLLAAGFTTAIPPVRLAAVSLRPPVRLEGVEGALLKILGDGLR